MMYPVCLLTIFVFLFLGHTNGLAQSAGPVVSTPFRILKQPRPKYTAAARKAGVEGTVFLRILLRADGRVGTITDVTEVRRDEMNATGLTDSAMRAARKIKFRPKTVNGWAVNVIITRGYSFTNF